MKTRLLITWAIAIMIIRVTAIVERQTAQAFPCVGGSVREYCTGYHDGAVQGYTDYKKGHDLDVDQHRCTDNSSDYCNGYNGGYTDEADFLG
jgi:hypothetical protein